PREDAGRKLGHQVARRRQETGDRRPETRRPEAGGRRWILPVSYLLSPVSGIDRRGRQGDSIGDILQPLDVPDHLLREGYLVVRTVRLFRYSYAFVALR